LGTFEFDQFLCDDLTHSTEQVLRSGSESETVRLLGNNGATAEIKCAAVRCNDGRLVVDLFASMATSGTALDIASRQLSLAIANFEINVAGQIPTNFDNRPIFGSITTTTITATSTTVYEAKAKPALNLKHVASMVGIGVLTFLLVVFVVAILVAVYKRERRGIRGGSTLVGGGSSLIFRPYEVNTASPYMDPQPATKNSNDTEKTLKQLLGQVERWDVSPDVERHPFDWVSQYQPSLAPAQGGSATEGEMQRLQRESIHDMRSPIPNDVISESAVRGGDAGSDGDATVIGRAIARLQEAKEPNKSGGISLSEAPSSTRSRHFYPENPASGGIAHF
jgi:hypothetical protein